MFFLFFLNFIYFYCLFFNYFIVVQLQLSAFLPTPPPHPSQTHLPLPPPLSPFVHVSFIVVPENPSPHCTLPPSLAIVRLFLISMSLVIFCLLFPFVDYAPVKGEIIWYLSLTTWLISLSIILFSSIPAVAKGISFFFLSAA